jgi:transcriptional regulator with XRE-family HTH domain
LGHQFGNRLRQLRSEWGLLQRELEELMALRSGSVSQYERGLREPGFDLLMAIADQLDVSVDYLLGRPFARQESSVLLEGRRVLQERLGQVQLPPGADARLALLLTEASKVLPSLFALPKLARLLQVSEQTLRTAGAGGGGISPAGREKLARHLGVGREWIDDSVRNL